MTTAALGNTVRFAFVGMLDDGSEFDRVSGATPVEAELGAGTVMPALEQALVGMTTGETKTVKIAAADAFGDRRDELVHTVEREQMPEDLELRVGQRLVASDGGGKQIDLMVVDLNEADVTLDGNHPLAGQDLTIELEMVEVL